MVTPPPLESESGRSKESTNGPVDSPSLTTHDDVEQLNFNHYIGIGAGEPVRTRSSAPAMISSRTEQGMLAEDDEKGRIGMKMAVKRKVLHFTVSI